MPEALPTAGGRAALPTTVEVATGRHPAEIEAAVYFCCLEALQNAGKHAGDGATAKVRVWDEDDVLHFEVSDDGAGFTVDRTHGFGELGHGFVNMGDRLGAIDGTLAIESAPGQGTKISGAIPLPAGLTRSSPCVDVVRIGAWRRIRTTWAHRLSESEALRHSLTWMTPDQRLAAIAAGQHGCATIEQALAAGLTRDQVYRRIRSGRLERLGHHVLRIAGAPATWEQALMAGLLDLGDGAVVSHRAAAALHGFDGFDPGPVEFLQPRRRRGSGVGWKVHTTVRLELIDRVEVDGFRCTSASRTVVDLAGSARVRALERAIDSAVRDGLSSPTFLAHRLRALRPRTRGSDPRPTAGRLGWPQRPRAPVPRARPSCRPASARSASARSVTTTEG